LRQKSHKDEENVDAEEREHENYDDEDIRGRLKIKIHYEKYKRSRPKPEVDYKESRRNSLNLSRQEICKDQYDKNIRRKYSKQTLN